MPEKIDPRGPRKCYNCDGEGHISRDCPNPRQENNYRPRSNNTRRCFNCGKPGHISSECTAPAGNKACYNCGNEGHISRDCPSQTEE